MQLNEMTYVTSTYNNNKDQYLELINIDENNFIIKASLWCKKGADSYLHIDKGKLFFDSGMHDNIAIFTIDDY